MATVKLTYNLKEDILNNIRNTYKNCADTPLDTLEKMDLGTEAYHLAFKEDEILLAQQLNDMSTEKWISKATSVIVKITYLSVTDEDTITSRDVRYMLPNPMIVPTDRLRSGYAPEIRLDLPAHAPSYEAAVKLLQEHDTIDAERRQTVRAIEHDILNKCVTLKQLLEVWPNAMEYIPEKAKERHNLRVTVNKSAPTEIIISDEVKASLIKTRMLTAGD